MAILIIAEHDNAVIKSATLNAVTAAAALGGEIHLLVAGAEAAPAAQSAANINGVAKALLAEAPHYAHGLPEPLAALATAIIVGGGYSHVIAAATAAGKNVAPRVAALLDAQQISDVTAVLSTDAFERPIYAGAVVVAVQCSDPVKVLTVRTTAFAPAAAEGGAGLVESVAPAADPGVSRFVSAALSQSVRPELTAARVVVSGGRGMGSAENFHIIEALADKLGAAVGASRAAVDAGYAPNDLQVGQTGKIVAPELYVAVGVSGAIQHLAGMKDSKIIVAVNKDEEAPIFQIADYGLVADLFKAVPELTAAL